MGRSHVTSGAVAFLAPTVILDAAPMMAISPWTMVLGTAVCAGAAVAPDIDHPKSGISMTFGPLTKAFAHLVRAVSGGHRNGTHSLLGVAVFSQLAFVGTALYQDSVKLFASGAGVSVILAFLGLLVGVSDTSKGRGRPAYKQRWHGYASSWFCAAAVLGLVAAIIVWPRQTGTALLCVQLIVVLAAAIRVMKIKGFLDDLAPIPITLFLVWHHVDLTLVPFAITLGAVVHLIGDGVTRGGVPLGWPWSQRMFSADWFRTNHKFENKVVFPILLAAFVVFAAVGTGVFDNFDLTPHHRPPAVSDVGQHP